MSLPSIAYVRAASMWYMLRYRVASEVVECFLWSRVDAIALAALIRGSYSVIVQIWFMSVDECFVIDE